jgi:hypothetical protein
MAEFNVEVALAIAPQSVLGTFDSTLAAVNTTVLLTDGLILGARGNGVKDSGIALVESRVETERPSVVSSFSERQGEFQRTEPSTFTLVFPFAGNRKDTTTPINTEFIHDKGIDALLKCFGFTQSLTGTPGALYTVGGVGNKQASATIWLSGMRYNIRDVFGITLAIPFIPGEIPLATATFQGKIDSLTLETFPTTVTYGVQDSVSALIVESVTHTWDLLKPFEDLTLTVNNTLEEKPDSNVETGLRTRQTARRIDIVGTIEAASGDIDYEAQNLRNAIENPEDVNFQVGLDNVGGQPALAYAIVAKDVQIDSIEPIDLGEFHGNVVNAHATTSVPDDELTIEFR